MNPAQRRAAILEWFVDLVGQLARDRPIHYQLGIRLLMRKGGVNRRTAEGYMRDLMDEAPPRIVSQDGRLVPAAPVIVEEVP